MSEGSLTIHLNGGLESTFHSWMELKAFLDKNESWWNSITQTLNKQGQSHAAQNLSSHRANLRQLVNQASETTPVSSFGQLQNFFQGNGPLIDSESRQGEAIKSAGRLGGPKSEAAAYATTAGWMALGGNNIGRQDAIALVVTAFPEFGEFGSLAERLTAERNNYRSSLTRRLADFHAASERQQTEWRSLLARAMAKSRSLARKRIRFWNQQELGRKTDADAAISSIKNTESTFTEFMRLRAAVKYWKEEESRHADAKRSAVKRLQWFFPLAAIGLIFGFFVGACVLLAADVGNRSMLQVVVGGALLTISTIMFWVGRLLTKLYLSEHHLEQDAAQRAVMMTTYLALLNEGGATADQDRSSILSALFRSTPDGIVKDEGVSDSIGVANLLAKLGAR